MELLNLDPKTTTAGYLFELDPIFECLVCNSLEEGRRVMAWETAVSFHILYYIDTQLISYLQVSHAVDGPRHCRENRDARAKLRLIEDTLSDRAREQINAATERHQSKKDTYDGQTRTTMMCTILGCMKKGKLMELRQHIRRE